jgi:hypothetical protein
MSVNHRRIPTLFPRLRPTSFLFLFLALCVVVTGTATAGEARRHVVDRAGIQTRIDQQLDQDGADRQAIQQFLNQPTVRQIAGSAGLDVQRAHAAAALLSGQELKDLASSAREVNAGIGGSSTVTITTTSLIIILLLLILLTD